MYTRRIAREPTVSLSRNPSATLQYSVESTTKPYASLLTFTDGIATRHLYHMTIQ